MRHRAVSFAALLGLATLDPVSGYAAATNFVSGAISGNTSWSNTVVVMGNVTVGSGATLSVLPGTQVRMSNSVSITAQSGGAIHVDGERTNQVFFSPFNSGVAWGNIAASGAGSSVSVKFAEVARGGINLGSSSTALIEDTYVHDVVSAIVGNSAASVMVRRVHVKNFDETIYNNTLAVVEDSLFENQTSASSDALEYQGAPLGCEVRRCTFRNSTGSNSDAFDCNGSSRVFIHDCVIHDFTDKGISFGAAGAGGPADYGMIVSNCLIYGVDTGIAMKDGSTASLFNNTIVNSAYGFRWYQKFQNGGGLGTNTYNNIVWGNRTNLLFQDGAALTAAYSDIQGTNFPGIGNISSDPLFVSAVGHDYRLQPGSPCIGTGSNHLDMGVLLPIGGVPASPLGLSAQIVGNNASISWAPPLDAHGFIYGYVLERATNGGAFSAVLGGNLILEPGFVGTNYFDTNLISGGTYLYRVRATNWIGSSPFTDAVTISLSSDRDGDGMPDGWETAHGLNPDDPLDASADADADGLTNLQEYLAGTDPHDAASRLFVRVGTVSTNAVLSFAAASNKTYTVEYRDSLATNVIWTAMQNISAGPERLISITNSPSVPARYFRVLTPSNP